MDHFKSLTLKNWLCYKKAVFNFHPGVNMIIGPTDHGKSAMMDALHKVITNRPMGDEFQSWWGGETYIGLKLDNSLIRYKKEKQATYQIKNLDTKKVITFTAFRATVPQEITDLLRMDRKINIQKQLEKKAPIFLLSENPADIARHLNEVANLGRIDICLANGKQSLGISTTKKKVIDAAIKAKTKELVKYDKLDEFKILVNHAEKLQMRLDKDKEMLDNLEYGLEAMAKISQKLKRVKTRLKLNPIIKEAIIQQTKIKRSIKQEQSYFNDLEELDSLQKRLVRIQNRLKLRPLIKRGSSLLLIIDQYESDITTFESGLESIRQINLDIKETKLMLRKKKQKYKSNFPDICPFCKSKVNKDTL